MQDGDVKITYADAIKLQKAIGYRPATKINTGLHKFVLWYKSFYSVAVLSSLIVLISIAETIIP
ncbi:MAG: hypothetical protein RIM68_09875 [Arenibacter sp.]